MFCILMSFGGVFSEGLLRVNCLAIDLFAVVLFFSFDVLDAQSFGRFAHC